MVGKFQNVGMNESDVGKSSTGSQLTLNKPHHLYYHAQGMKTGMLDAAIVRSWDTHQVRGARGVRVRKILGL